MSNKKAITRKDMLRKHKQHLMFSLFNFMVSYNKIWN